MSATSTVSLGQQTALSARELFEAVGIDETAFGDLQTSDLDEPSSNDIQSISQIASTFQRFDRNDIERWANRLELDTSAGQIANIYRVDGVVTQIESTVTATGEMLYRIDLRLPSQFENGEINAADRPASIWLKQIPGAWKSCLFTDVNITAGCYGVLVQSTDGISTLVSDRVEWFPKSSDSGPMVSSNLLTPAAIGIDVSLFDTLEHGRKVTAHDRECFYQMLARADRIATMAGESQFSIAEFLQMPHQQAGTIYTLTGVARRAIRISVSDPDIQERFGIDHYYEVDVFVPLEPALTLVDSESGDKNTYRAFPMTFCVRSLPPGFPEGPVITQPVAVTAMYFKLWAYRNELLNADRRHSSSAAKMQQSPLFIGYAPIVRVPAKGTSATIEIVAGVAFILAFAVVTGILIRISRRDRANSRRRNSVETVTIEMPESN